MPILRFRPGEIAPAEGKFELVDHFGERLNVVIWCEAGERLPLTAVAGVNRIWFVQADEIAVAARAA
jgi:hypothetical protein